MTSRIVNALHPWLSCVLALVLSGLSHAAPDDLTQAVTHQGLTATLRLTRLDLRGQHFEVLAQNSTGTYDPFVPVAERSYLGTVDEFPGAVSAGILKDDGTFWGAVIFDRGGTWHTLGGAVTSTRYDNARPNFAFPSLELTPGQAGTTTYGFDIAADVNSDSFTATGGSIAKSLEGVEYTVTVLRALYMSNALLRPHLARVVIRTSAEADTLKGMSSNATLPALKTEWLANHADANRDFVALAGRAMGGLSYGPGIGTPWGYTVQPSENDGNFWVYLRHELAHNMNVGHGDGGGPEGETINGRYNNGYARLGTSELERMLDYRDSVIAQYDNEGTFTAIDLPPYACLDSAVIQRPGSTQATLNVMANDHDANGHAITGIVSFDAISNKGGTVTQTGSGASAQLVYTPRSDFAGFDWFYYTVTDSSGQTATGLVTVDVNPPDTSFAGWWRLDETSGPDYHDSSPMGTDITSENISSGLPGKFGNAATFSASSSQVPVVRTALGSPSSTITAWIRRSSTTDQPGFAGIVFNRVSGTPSGLHFGTANELRYTWNGSHFNWNSGLVPPADQWVLVALVVEPTQATIFMHDGTTLSSAVNTAVHAPSMTSGVIHLGRDTNSSSRRFVGNMDDVRLFRRALSEPEIFALVTGGPAETPAPFDTATGVADTTLAWQPDPQATLHHVYIGTDAAAVSSATTASPEYQGSTPLSAWSFAGTAGTTYHWRVDSVNPDSIVPGKVWSFSTGTTVAPPDPSSGLLAHWTLDESEGTLAASTTGTHPGTVVGSPARMVGIEGGAISFDGVNDGVTTGSPLLSNRSSFTMSGWYRSPLTTGNRVALWGQNDVVEFGINGSNLSLFTAAGGSLAVPLPTPDEWHHVTCVGDGFSLKIYIDGLLAASGGSYVANAYGSSTASGFNIGTATWDSNGNWFTGQIDDVRVYHRALSDIEVFIQANALPSFALTTAASPSQGGSVAGAGTFTQGTVQPITATAASGWHFVDWTGDSIADPFASATTITINAAKAATANFAINTYSLSYTAGPNGSLTGNAAQTIDHGSDGTAITAVPSTGYSFVNWSDGGTANPRTDSNLTATLAVTANFAINTYSLSYSAGPNGSLTGNPAQTIDHGSDGTAITAVPATGYSFVDWSDGGTSNPRTDANVTANLEVTANFAINTYSLSYSAGPNGSLAGATGQTVDHGSDSTPVTAIPASGHHFVDWSDGSTSNPRTDTNITADLSVTARFEFTNPDANGNGILDPWETDKFGNASPGANSPDGDPDHDGLSNLLEYALDTHPLVPNASTLVYELVPLPGGKHLRLTVPKNPVATNLTYSIEVSGDLEGPSWTTAGTTVETDSPAELKVRDDTGTGTAARRFIRLKVTAD